MTDRTQLFVDRFGLPPRHDAGEVNKAVEALLQRRVCRDFASEGISDGDLETLLAAAQSAPAKSDLQQFSIIIASPAQRDRVSDLIESMPWIKDAGRFLLFCGDMRRGQRVAAWKGKIHVNNTLDTFMNAAVDGGIAMMSLIAAATLSGFGTCPVSAVRAHMAEVTALFKLPDGVFPITGLALGVPASDGHMSMRLPSSVVVHHETYDDASLEEDLTAYDTRRNDRFAYRTQMHVDRFGESSAYGWSENTARRLAHRERANFGDYLRAHGFDLE